MKTISARSRIDFVRGVLAVGVLVTGFGAKIRADALVAQFVESENAPAQPMLEPTQKVESHVGFYPERPADPLAIPTDRTVTRMSSPPQRQPGTLGLALSIVFSTMIAAPPIGSIVSNEGGGGIPPSVVTEEPPEDRTEPPPTNPIFDPPPKDTPEPSTLVSAFVGTLLVGVYRSRRRRKRTLDKR